MTRAVRAAALAVALPVLLAACGERWKPTAPGFAITGSPVVTSESGTTGMFQVALTTAPKAAVDVELLCGDASEGLLIGPGGGTPAARISLRFDPSDWSTPQGVTVKGVDDLVRDGDVTWRVRIVVVGSGDPDYAGALAASVEVVNRDDDTPGIRLSRTALTTHETGATTDAFEVVLASQPMEVVTVPVRSGEISEGLLTGGASGIVPGAAIVLLFTPSNWSTPQPVTVTGQRDHVVDGDQTYAVTVGPATGDPAYASLPAQVVTVTNVDTDVPAFLLSTHTLTLSEWGYTSFGVRLATIPGAAISVPIAIADPGSALVQTGTGSNAQSATLSFDATNWDVEQRVNVVGVPNNVVDGPKTTSIAIGPTTGDAGYAAVAQELIGVTVLNADVPGICYASFGWIATSEAGKTSTIQVSLCAAPAADVQVPVTSSDAAEALVSVDGAPPSSTITLTFTTTNWNVPRIVTVSGVDDAILELGPPHPFTVTLGPTRSSSAPYDGVTGWSIPGTNADDEVAPNEGTQNAPLELTGLLPYAGKVGTGSSWYRVTGYPDGAYVAIKGNVDVVALAAWDESATPVKLCSAPGPFTPNLIACAVRLPAGGSFRIQVDGSKSARGATFTLDVAAFTFATDTPLGFPATGATAGSTSTLSLTGVPGECAGFAAFVEIATSDTTVSSRLGVSLMPPGTNTMYQLFGWSTGGIGLDRTVFDASAPTYVGTAPVPYAGTYRPAVAVPCPLNANGDWKLWVYGDRAGTIVRWGVAAR